MPFVLNRMEDTSGMVSTKY